ncbi:hypothetical protein [Baaleninema sp.]|uniref:hypothetical protein n=1 Tax=Baaleninema sp. TaxID=3101197 RepID=UPI003CFE20B9
MFEVSSALKSQLLTRQTIWRSIFGCEPTYREAMAIDFEVWSNCLWVLYRPQPGYDKGFCRFVSFKDVAIAVVEHTDWRSQQLQALKGDPIFCGDSSYLVRGFNNDYKVSIDPGTSELTCNCKLFRCLNNREGELPEAFREALHKFGRYLKCHHILAVEDLLDPFNTESEPLYLEDDPCWWMSG